MATAAVIYLLYMKEKNAEKNRQKKKADLVYGNVPLSFSLSAYSCTRSRFDYMYNKFYVYV